MQSLHDLRHCAGSRQDIRQRLRSSCVDRDGAKFLGLEGLMQMNLQHSTGKSTCIGFDKRRAASQLVGLHDAPLTSKVLSFVLNQG